MRTETTLTTTTRVRSPQVTWRHGSARRGCPSKNSPQLRQVKDGSRHGCQHVRSLVAAEADAPRADQVATRHIKPGTSFASRKVEASMRAAPSMRRSVCVFGLCRSRASPPLGVGSRRMVEV